MPWKFVLLALAVIAVGALILTALRVGHSTGRSWATRERTDADERATYALAQWEFWERKAEEFRALNSSVLIERDNWQRLYWDQAAGHGNAQAMMMGTIHHLGGKLAGLGHPVPIPPVIQEVMDEFTGRHVNSVPRKADPAQIPRPSQDGAPGPDTLPAELPQVPRKLS